MLVVEGARGPAWRTLYDEEHRLGTPQHRCRLTNKNLGWLPRTTRDPVDLEHGADAS